MSKTGTLIFILNIYLICNAFSQQDWSNNKISGKYYNADFLELLVDLETKFGFQFYFEPEWLESVTFSANFTNQEPDSVLHTIVKDLPLQLYHLHDREFVLYPNQLSMAGYSQKQNQVIRLGNPTKSNFNQGHIISGYVVDGNDQTPLAGVNIQVLNTHTWFITNNQGYFSCDLSVGRHSIAISSIGYESCNLDILVFSDDQLLIELYEKTFQIETAHITASRSNRELLKTYPGLTNLTKNDLKTTPGLLGENDLIRGATLLPGINSVGESASGITVRGGSPDQNLFLSEGIPLFNYSHVFGFFSALNPALVKEFSVYKGFIPVNYGGRLSSVMAVKFDDVYTKNIEGQGNMGLVSSSGKLNLPLFDTKAMLIIAGRGSYTEWILNRIELSEIQNSSSDFYDVNAIYHQNFLKDGTLNLSYYLSKDNFAFNDLSDHSYNTNYFKAGFKKPLKDKLNSSVSLFYSTYHNRLTETFDSIFASVYSSGINTIGGNVDISYFLNSNSKLLLGTTFLHNKLILGKRFPLYQNSVIPRADIGVQECIESAYYVGHSIEHYAGFNFDYGIRYSVFYNSNENMRYNRIEPRMAVMYTISSANSAKISYTSTTQYLHLLTNTMGITPTDTWRISSGTLRPQLANQIGIGISKTIKTINIETAVDFYYKQIKHVTDLHGGSDMFMNRKLEEDVLSGEGRISGVELFIKKSGKLSGHLSYSAGRSQRKMKANNVQDNINKGNWYASDYDIPHNFKALISYQIKSRITVASDCVFSSGRPATYPIGYYYWQDIPVIQYSEKNTYRLPPYKRIDLSVTMKLYKRNNVKIKSELTFSVYNILGWDNTYSVFFRNEDNLDLNGYQVLLINRQVPALAWTFSF